MTIGRLKHPKTMQQKARSRKQPETQSDLMRHGPSRAVGCTPHSALHPPYLRLYAAQHPDCGATAKRYRHAAYVQRHRNAGRPAFAGLPVAICAVLFVLGAVVLFGSGLGSSLNLGLCGSLDGLGSGGSGLDRSITPDRFPLQSVSSARFSLFSILLVKPRFLISLLEKRSAASLWAALSPWRATRFSPGCSLP